MNRDAKTTLEEFASRAGWNVHSMLELACEYIDNQQSTAAFEDFVKQAAREEEGTAFEEYIKTL